MELLLSLPILLLAEHVYSPLSSLDVLVIIKVTLTFVILLIPISPITLLPTDTLSLKAPLVLLHTIFGEGMPIDSQVNVMFVPSSTVVALFNGVMIFG